MKQRILGLDTGTNSLGWAIVDRYDDNHYELVKQGVLIFQEGVKIEKGIESSKAAERTSHRALRRQYFRRRLHKIEVLRVLYRHDLCPAIGEEDLRLWRSRKIYPTKPEFMEWQRTRDDEDRNPYHCRYICLTERLDLDKRADRYVLGRAMYHLAQRRGFLSNRLDTSEDNAENSPVKRGIADVSNKMSQAGCRYLGEYFYHIYKEKGNTERIRVHHTDREKHYRAEFDAICRQQNLSEELRNELERAIYFQRPLKSQRKSVGCCTFEKGKPRACISHYAFEEYRMLSFINTIRILTPYDTEPRPLSETERKTIEPLFYRKSKENFTFEDIAKAIAGKGNYMTMGDKGDRAYRFNYRMTQGVSGCPTMAQLRSVFDDDWMRGIAETYVCNTRKDGTQKTVEEMADDVWNVLMFFDSKEKLKEFAINKLQLDEEKADKFANIRLKHDYASLSIKAIRNILPFLRRGMLYSHAAFLAKIPEILGQDKWQDAAVQQRVMDEMDRLTGTVANEGKGGKTVIETGIKDFLKNEFGMSVQALEAMYHPSMIETYPDPRPNEDGVILLGSPRTNALRNPMAMRSMHQLRRLINSLILEGLIDHSTIVHIEYARELNNANQRAAIYQWQRQMDKKHKEYADIIRKECNIEPIETDILKYQLWEEQEHICLYTGKQIGVNDFLGPNPTYDIEHTIPRSVGGDSTQENMTLCSFDYNRNVKKARIPSELPPQEYEAIIERIQGWKEKIEELSKKVDRLSHGSETTKEAKDKRIQKRNLVKIELAYWRGKYVRFTMKEVPEGFARRQGAGAGLISKYAGLYLRSYFKSVEHPERRQIYTIKGTATAEFRKMWGIQEAYDKKSRDNHTHHCIDAIVIACIGKREYDATAKYYHQQEEYRFGQDTKPNFPKPWPTFTEDVKRISDEIAVVHNTPDNMPKKASRCIDVTGKGKVVAKGDCARGSLHKDTYYGAIKRNGEILYVVRRELSSFEKLSDIDNIVDYAVREKVCSAVEGRDFKKAIAQPIYMNKEKGILIKKVRCYAGKPTLDIRHHRDQSTKPYKQRYHVVNDENYCMAIYEGVVKGKAKRSFLLVNMLDAASHFKQSNDDRTEEIVPLSNASDWPLKYVLKIGTNVLFYETYPQEVHEADNKELVRRLYKVVGMSRKNVSGYKYGEIVLRHVAEAKPSKEIKYQNGVYRQGEELRAGITMLHTQINALVEGYDFDITPIGEIKFR